MRARHSVALLPLLSLVVLGLGGCTEARTSGEAASPEASVVTPVVPVQTPTTEPQPAAEPAAEAAISWPEKCYAGTRVLCADQGNNKVAYFRDGTLVHQLDARFGPSGMPGVSPTRNGDWTVFRKVADDWSSLYQQPMIHALYFSGGEAVHYSPHFDQTGYSETSHGCINVRDEAAMQAIFHEVRTGDPVYVWGTPPPAGTI